MMRLRTLLQPWLLGQAPPSADPEIDDIQLDSRKIGAGGLFLAVPGTRQHGLSHARQAVANGAVAVAYDPAGRPDPAAAGVDGVPVLAIDGLAAAAGAIAARFFGHPANGLTVIGVTGTNGKTSCSQFLAQLLPDCAVIGTLGWGRPGRLRPTGNTTPDAVALQAMLAALKGQGLGAVAMEVSSHGLAQHRVDGVAFTGAVYTNISRDHLDYHGSMDAYLNAKLRLLAMPGLKFAVINLDDGHAATIAAAASGLPVWGFSLAGRRLAAARTVNGHIVGRQAQGVELAVDWDGQRQTVTVPLHGDFNCENALAVLAVLLALGGGFQASVAQLAGLRAVPGRMQRCGGGGRPLVFVDYAHTPDALAKVLASARRHCQGKLWVVFGCGGDRDAGKRPLMRAVAERLADHIIVTDDNPRFEDSAAIIADIVGGAANPAIRVTADRAQAIADAIAGADDHDCLVIAGKGHEAYQEINGQAIPFDDREVAERALARRRPAPCG